MNRTHARSIAVGTDVVRRAATLVVATTVVCLGLVALGTPSARASTVSSAVFTGGAGTVSVGGDLYAKQGGALALSVVTSSDTKCVDVAGALTAHQQSSTAKTNWTFSFTAPGGDGAQAVTVSASPDFNPQNKCTGTTRSTQASYTLDNTGPVLVAALTPAANGAGWNKADVAIAWTATDAGSGVAAAQPFQTDSVTSNGIVTKTAPAQADRLGNVGAPGAVTVRVDKNAPTITAAQTKNADGTTTITFTCTDGVSGVASCLAQGSATNSKTVGPATTVTGTATDLAGNVATENSTSPPDDTTPPTLVGAPTTQPNASGWYNGNVTIHWTCADEAGGSGLPAGACPADDQINGEGAAQTVTRSLSDNAGNTTTSTSSPAVSIDKTAPTTGISGTSNAWVNGTVDVTLTPTDNLSGVAATSFRVDGGSPQSGTTLSISTEGDHTIAFFSTDRAGNAETSHIVHVLVDQTAPTIGHLVAPSWYADGAWTNGDIEVTFECADQGGSGLDSCTAPVTVSEEGAGQQVVGTATDFAGNQANDTAIVNIDKTPPTIVASADRGPNAAGWYDDDVTVSFEAHDALSGIASSPEPIVLGEGADQSASGTATDAAGNTAGDEISGIDIDKTAPSLSGSFPPGWHNDDVAVAWSCTDQLSGPKAQPDDTTVSGEGDNLSSTASCEDGAGNSTTEAVTGVMIDRTAPTTTPDVPAPNGNGWYHDAVQVTLHADDNLSGVAATMFSIDGAPAQDYNDPFEVAAMGVHTVSFWSVDSAGNTELAGTPITLRVDKTAPVTTVTNPISPASGWFVTSGIPFAFDADDELSGVSATYYAIDGGDPQTYGEPFTADLSTGSHTVTYWSVDLAGNKEATGTFDVKVDTIPPAITGHRAPAANAYGWNNSDVSVMFECSDADSGIDGIAGCGPDQIISAEGGSQQVTGYVQDVAGNDSSTVVGDIDIDKTPPALVGAATTDPNGAGWYNADVTIAWTGQDGLAGIDPASQPADDVITGEGSNLGASASIDDKAGNSTSASVSGVRIDRTPPSIAGGPTTQPNAAGWYRDPVTVDFTCTDNLSGVAACPSSKVISGDGAGQSVTSDPASDKAGNDSAGKTVGGVDIDGTAPSTTVDNKCTKVNDWCTGATASVVLTASDQAGLSGVKAIYYRIDGGAVQSAAGSTKTVSVPLSGSGSGNVTYWAVDYAGNTEPQNSVSLKWDNIAPTVTHTVSPAANALDWNNSSVTVHFNAKDDDAGSGVASVTAEQTVSAETAGTVVTGTAADTAGNVGTDAVTVKLDKTAPTISAAIVSGARGGNGWYVGPVRVHFACADALSGVAVCPDDVILTDNGANTASGTVIDKAGNSASAAITGIYIDQEKPTITGVNVANGSYTLGAVPAASCAARDSFSGVQSCTVIVTGGGSNGVGTFSYTATAADMAGNTSTGTGTYKVKYDFDGFLQPINDTAHQVGLATSVFKAGSTVPAKFQLRNSAGQLVQVATAPVWLAPVKGGSMSMPVDETLQTVAADSGSAYRYDVSAQQYIYNWKTPSGSGFYYQIGVRLDDGQTYYVNIGLR